MDILFIVYIICVLVLVLYLIYFKYFNSKIRNNLVANTETTTSVLTDNEIRKIDCKTKTIYCSNDYDCLQVCSNAINDSLQMEYKCSEVNICTQSPLLNSNENTDLTAICNTNFGFFPVLTADEIFQPQWTCINTQPYLFNDQQQYHPYVCANGNREKLDPKKVFESCVCPAQQIKVRDEFRNNIPLCVDKNQLSLFPNFNIQ